MTYIMVYYERLQFRNSPMEEKHTARYGEGAQSFHALSRLCHLRSTFTWRSSEPLVQRFLCKFHYASMND